MVAKALAASLCRRRTKGNAPRRRRESASRGTRSGDDAVVVAIGTHPARTILVRGRNGKRNPARNGVRTGRAKDDPTQVEIRRFRISGRNLLRDKRDPRCYGMHGTPRTMCRSLLDPRTLPRVPPRHARRRNLARDGNHAVSKPPTQLKHHALPKVSPRVISTVDTTAEVQNRRTKRRCKGNHHNRGTAGQIRSGPAPPTRATNRPGIHPTGRVTTMPYRQGCGAWLCGGDGCASKSTWTSLNGGVQPAQPGRNSV
mmetsp:Transcript_4523/g.28740  ORF Transcript_4523/g.28740 Transcript_4523/m.28740 type:complete len:256 (-) Transcript_4523:1534-2301(-)